MNKLIKTEAIELLQSAMVYHNKMVQTNIWIIQLPVSIALGFL